MHLNKMWRECSLRTITFPINFLIESDCALVFIHIHPSVQNIANVYCSISLTLPVDPRLF